MAITTLDPKTALIVIDLQTNILALPTNVPTEPVLEKAVRLVDAFRRHRLPVVLVNVAGGAPGRSDQAPAGGGATYPDEAIALSPALNAQTGDILITKRTWGAFAQTSLADRLRDRAVTQVVICGVATSIGVESTAREAFALGFNVTLTTDAMADLSAETHANSIERIFPRLGETGSSDDVLALLEARA